MFGEKSAMIDEYSQLPLVAVICPAHVTVTNDPHTRTRARHAGRIRRARLLARGAKVARVASAHGCSTGRGQLAAAATAADG